MHARLTTTTRRTSDVSRANKLTAHKIPQKIVSVQKAYINQACQDQLVHVDRGSVSKIEDEWKTKTVGTFVDILLICKEVDEKRAGGESCDCCSLVYERCNTGRKRNIGGFHSFVEMSQDLSHRPVFSIIAQVKVRYYTSWQMSWQMYFHELKVSENAA